MSLASETLQRALAIWRDKDQGGLMQALPVIEDALRACEVKEDLAECAFYAACAFMEAKMWRKAQPLCKLSVQLCPDRGNAWLNYGMSLELAGDYPKAAAALYRASERMPDDPRALCALGNVFYRMGKHRQARQAHDAAIALSNDRPIDAEGAYAVSFVELMRGHWKRGYGLHEVRWNLPQFLASNGRTFLWPKLESLSHVRGKVIYVYAEQGAGDNIMAARFVHDLLNLKPKHIVLETSLALKRLFAKSFPQCTVIAAGDEIPSQTIDYHYPLYSLPLLLGIEPQTLNATVPYLSC